MQRRPSLIDDGTTVTLDLHGARVQEAERLVLNAAEQASGAGRQTLRIIHGASTTAWDRSNRTVKTAVLDLLDDGELDAWVASELRMDGSILIGLYTSGSPVRQRLSLLDL